MFIDQNHENLAATYGTTTTWILQWLDNQEYNSYIVKPYALFLQILFHEHNTIIICSVTQIIYCFDIACHMLLSVLTKILYKE